MPLSPYIRSVRERLGRQLLLLPTVAVLPRDDQGRLLLVRQIDTGLWGTIGGSIEPDEAPEEAARRADAHFLVTVTPDDITSFARLAVDAPSIDVDTTDDYAPTLEDIVAFIGR